MTPADKVHRLSFGTSYRQFYFVDRDVKHDTGSGFWTDDALARGLAVRDGMLGVGTVSYGRIRRFFQLSEAEPTLALSPWQRVVEGSIHLTKGRYAILDCPDSIVDHEGPHQRKKRGDHQDSQQRGAHEGKLRPFEG